MFVKIMNWSVIAAAVVFTIIAAGAVAVVVVDLLISWQLLF